MTHHTVIEGIADPVEERDWRKEVVLLTELIQLGITVEHARRNKLVEDTDDEGREDGKDDIVVCHGPSFKRDLARKVIEPGVLIISIRWHGIRVTRLTQNRVTAKVMFL